MITVVTFLWGNKYTPMYVERAAAGVRRQLRQAHRFIVLTEPDRIANFSSGIERHALPNPELVGRGCFPRLRLFDPEWQASHGIEDRLVCVDLDNVIVGPLDPLFDRPEPLLVPQGVNMVNPCPYNCSLFMLRRGAHPEVWREFSLEAAKAIRQHEFPDDQGWLWHMVPDPPAGWQVGPDSGIWAFGKGRGRAAWPADSRLPPGARVVAFPGGRDPSKFAYLSWVKEHWREG